MARTVFPCVALLAVAGGIALLPAGCAAPPKHPRVPPSRRVPLIERAGEADATDAGAAPGVLAPREELDALAPRREPDALAPDATLDELRLHAARDNPGLRALYDRWRAQADRAPQVRALPEPRFTFMEYLRSVQTRAGPQERSFGLSQAFPWFGKLGLRGSIEEKRAASAWQRFLGAQLALDYQLRVAYADYFYLGRSVAVTRENLALLSRLERVAREKFAAGAENHPDVIRLQVEIGRLEDRLRSLSDMQRPMRAKLNALLSRDAGAEIVWPDELPASDFEPAEGELAEFLTGHNPELVALRHEVESADLRRELAFTDYYPNFALGVQTISTGSALVPNMRDSGEDPWMVSISIDLPLWYTKYRAGVREAEASASAAREERRDATNRLVAEVELALFELRDARRRVELYDGTLIRKAEEALASIEASFQADSSDFLDLIDAERALLEFQLALERARADRLRAQAKLERHLGRFVIERNESETRS